MKTKKIGIIGWWQGMNEGDMYIKNCLERYFSEFYAIEFIATPFLPNRGNLHFINKLDFLLIGGGGLFTKTPPSPFDSFNVWGSQLKVPFGFIGLGIQEIGDAYREIIKSIFLRSSFSVLRDNKSKDFIEPFAKNLIVAPDLTFLYPRLVAKKCFANKIGVNLRIWDFDKQRTYDNVNWINQINLIPGQKCKIALSFLPEVDDRVALKDIEGEQKESFDIRSYQDIRIMIGMRLHSLIFAVQNAVPVIGIAYTPKIKRFLAQLNMDRFCLEVDEYGLIQDKYNELMKESSQIEKYFTQQTIKLQKQILKALDMVTKIIGV